MNSIFNAQHRIVFKGRMDHMIIPPKCKKIPANYPVNKLCFISVTNPLPMVSLIPWNTKVNGLSWAGTHTWNFLQFGSTCSVPVDDCFIQKFPYAGMET